MLPAATGSGRCSTAQGGGGVFPVKVTLDSKWKKGNCQERGGNRSQQGMHLAGKGRGLIRKTRYGGELV